jgi:hypothetical protein
MPNKQTIRSTIIRKIQRHIKEGRPEIAVLIVAFCSAAVTICVALIASILLAVVSEMRKPSNATHQECGDPKQQDSSAVASLDRVQRVQREDSFTLERYVRRPASADATAAS